jgi:hypothetical protein
MWHGARASGFWLAVVLPVAYPVVLVAGGWVAESRMLLVGVLCVHLLALILGQGYETRTADR